MASLFWRIPLALGFLYFAWRSGLRRSLWVGLIVVGALSVDLLVPAQREPDQLAALLTEGVASIQQRLDSDSRDPRLIRLLSPAGGEVAPEQAFVLVNELSDRLPNAMDSFVLVDERGLPVAWTGNGARLPVGLRPLGENAVIAEPGVGAIWIWWRQMVFESGRPLGALLVGLKVDEDGVSRMLGCWAGRSSWIVLGKPGGTIVKNPAGNALFNFELQAVQVPWWSAPALAAILTLGVLAFPNLLLIQLWVLLGVLLPCLLSHRLGPGWWLIFGCSSGALLFTKLPRRWWVRVGGAVCVGTLAYFLPQIVDILSYSPLPDHLLWPEWERCLAVIALTLLVVSAARGRSLPQMWLRGLALVPLILGAVSGSPLLLGVGAAVAVGLAVTPRRFLVAALIAAGMMLGAGFESRRTKLVLVTEATLERMTQLRQQAEKLLADLPESGLDELVRLEARERLLLLGRAAGILNLQTTTPGASLVLVDPSGEVVTTWGESPLGAEGYPQQLAVRSLIGGWQIAVVVPASPHDMLAALDAMGIVGPYAAYDRSGSPVSRRATFKPLSPERIGAALASGRSWTSVGVGERSFPCYLRARDDIVLAVPWVRPPLLEMALILAALTLWGAVPLALGSNRRRWQRWWRQRNTFAGRMRLFSAAVTVIPVFFLGQFLSQQWLQQRERARLDLGRVVSQSLAAAGWEEGLVGLVREMGGVVVIYRGGAFSASTRPDFAIVGKLPWLAPGEAFVRSIRGWQEPLVTGGTETNVYAPLRWGEEPVVIGLVGLNVASLGRAPSPAEWFTITGILALMASFTVAERLGQRLAFPLRRLLGAARRLGRGEEPVRLTISGDEDVAALARAFVSMASDVRRREEDLRRERDLLDRVLAALSAAVIVVDQRGEVELANRAARGILRDSSGLAELAQTFSPAITGLVARAAAGEGVEETVSPQLSPDALWRVSVAPLRGAGGRVLLVLEDLSEFARAERLSSLAELARIVAHEVKNPLTPIRLWAEELQASLQRQPKDVVEVARVAADQILERVVHLRDVAQGFGNLVALERWEAKVMSLRQAVNDVASEYQVLEHRGIVITTSGEETTISADPLWVRRAIRHLFENSLKAIGNRSGEVRVSIGSEGEHAALVIQDSGGGVREDLLPRLFEPHFSTTSEGSGLGLAVVSRVAARAGGRAEARNIPGGLEVRLTFPKSGPFC